MTKYKHFIKFFSLKLLLISEGNKLREKSILKQRYGIPQYDKFLHVFPMKNPVYSAVPDSDICIGAVRHE